MIRVFFATLLVALSLTAGTAQAATLMNLTASGKWGTDIDEVKKWKVDPKQQRVTIAITARQTVRPYYEQCNAVAPCEPGLRIYFADRTGPTDRVEGQAGFKCGTGGKYSKDVPLMYTLSRGNVTYTLRNPFEEKLARIRGVRPRWCELVLTLSADVTYSRRDVECGEQFPGGMPSCPVPEEKDVTLSVKVDSVRRGSAPFAPKS